MCNPYLLIRINLSGYLVNCITRDPLKLIEMEVSRNFDLLSRYAEKFKKEDALCFRHEGKWKKYSS